MLALDFITWWYGRGWQSLARKGWHRLDIIFRLFSVELLLRTLVSPWRRIITDPGASLDAKLWAWGDNLFSRAVGFVVRCCVLLAAGFSSIIFSLVEVILLIAWPLLPVSVIVCLILGVVA